MQIYRLCSSEPSIFLKRMNTWNGNADFTLIDAIMFIPVSNDDDALFQKGIARLASRVPAYSYDQSLSGAEVAD